MTICIICEKELVIGWTLYHGEGYCVHCGMVYDMKGYRDTPETKHRVKDEAVPIFKEYWEQEKKPVCIGTWVTHTVEQQELIHSFNRWISNNHPELLVKAE